MGLFLTFTDGSMVRFHTNYSTPSKVEVAYLRLNWPLPLPPKAGKGKSDGPGTYRRITAANYPYPIPAGTRGGGDGGTSGGSGGVDGTRGGGDGVGSGGSGGVVGNHGGGDGGESTQDGGEHGGESTQATHGSGDGGESSQAIPYDLKYMD